MSEFLLVKTSSMGDVINALPVVSDIRRHFPEAQVDWVVEEGFADIPMLHPGVRTTLPVAIRRWRGRLAAAATWAQIKDFKATLRARQYEAVLDIQGLIKSAWITRLARGPRCGLDWKSAWEPPASLWYDRTFRVDPSLHAIERYRRLAAAALGYGADAPLDYGLRVPAEPLSWAPDAPYAVLLHATSRDEKRWDDAAWLELARFLHGRGLAAVLPWGSPRERAHAEFLAGRMPAARVAPAMRLREAAALIAQARLVVGVDTGLVHLAAALGTPVIALFCGSDPAQNGVRARTPAVNLGRAGQCPPVGEVLSAVEALAAA
ncbi:MAG: lipopolysaccharide heptosyltransferase I [Betaproteobacteria bacterium]|nr:lipopolysaccharide heptosyltransferase I [Betaproteobacteria bacterium]